MNEVVAVVVTYNRKDLLKICLQKLIEQKGISTDIYVVDNASNDGTAEMVYELYNVPVVFYYNTGSNLGGAGGFEYGVKKAVEAGYKYVWLLDDDTLVENNALTELFNADRKLNGNWGWLSSVAYWTDGSYCQANVQKKNIFIRLKSKDYSKPIIKATMASFVSLLVKADVIRELGLPIGEYFIWTDDYEFTGRISQKYVGYVVTNSKVVHAMKKHTRVKLSTATFERMDRYSFLYRNDVHCYRRYGLLGWIYILSKNLYTILSVLICAKENRFEKIKVLWRGFRKGLVFNPKIEMIS